MFLSKRGYFGIDLVSLISVCITLGFIRTVGRWKLTWMSWEQSAPGRKVNTTGIVRKNRFCKKVNVHKTDGYRRNLISCSTTRLAAAKITRVAPVRLCIHENPEEGAILSK